LYNEDFRKMVEEEGGEKGLRIGCVFTGGNVSLDALGELFGTMEGGLEEAAEKDHIGE
jgi:threonine dehydratase